jgi:hypothetical protein
VNGFNELPKDVRITVRITLRELAMQTQPSEMIERVAHAIVAELGRVEE